MSVGVVSSQVYLERELQPIKGPLIAWTSKPYPVELNEYLRQTPIITELLLKVSLIRYEWPAEYLRTTPKVVLLKLSPIYLYGPEYIRTTPTINRLGLSPVLDHPAEYLRLIPVIQQMKYSITYSNWLPEYLSVTPTITELTLA